MVSSSIKPGDQTDETESPNLVNKTELTGEYQSFSFYKVFWETSNGGGYSSHLKQQEIKELLAGSYNFLAEVLPAFSKLEIGIVKLKVKQEEFYYLVF